jgi:hypothetical protein
VILTSHEYVVGVTTFFECVHELSEMHGKINDLFPQKFTRRKKESKEANKTNNLFIFDLASRQYISICKLGVH